jgi:pantothenate synthetase
MSTVRGHVAEWKTVAVSLGHESVLGRVPTMGALHDDQGDSVG